MSLDLDKRRKLVRLLGKLGTDNDNERANVAKLIEAGRASLNLQWEDLIVPAGQSAGPRPGMDFNGASRGGSRSPSPGRGSSVADLFDDPDEFRDLLNDAEAEARTDKAADFVADMREKFERYGERLFLSEKQLAWLRSIANGE